MKKYTSKNKQETPAVPQKSSPDPFDDEIDEHGIQEWNKKYAQKALKEHPIEFLDDYQE